MAEHNRNQTSSNSDDLISSLLNRYSSHFLNHFASKNDTLSCSFHEWSRTPNQAGFLRIFSIVTVLTILVVVVVFGNSLVIAAVMLRRRLRSATGLLILSLAVADLMVGVVILPFSIANEVLDGFWIFGDRWCTIWLTMDIWMCTASIYNLVAISIDRYIAILKPLNYPMLITKFRARCIVALVWLSSFVVCSPSFILASADKPIEDKCKCTPAYAGTAYIIFSASSSFYIPMVVVIFVYMRIYVAACAATKSLYSGMMPVAPSDGNNAKSFLMHHTSALTMRNPQPPMLRVHRGSRTSQKAVKHPSAQVSVSSSSQRSSNLASRMNSNKNVLFAGCDHSSQRRYSDLHFKYRRDSHELTPKTTNDSPISPLSQRTEGIQNSATSTTSESVASAMKLRTKSCDDSPKHEFPTSTPAADEKTVGREQALSSTNDEKQPKNQLDTPSQIDDKTAAEKVSHRINISNALSRLMPRSHRKKAACAYEKRLSVEIKAAKTVAIVTGCFIFCWLGFSILYGFAIETSPVIWSILFWLGYLNSALNPVIYTVFNREFRTCFKRLLTCSQLTLTQQSIRPQLYSSYSTTRNDTMRRAGCSIGTTLTFTHPTNKLTSYNSGVE
ncbi:Octopamine receptor 1 [Toxocara canis]|uniref:Octopamine receptor 1 n=1 Tax=Toxocara canis TaxID=6265 RepID=A0A0B2W5J0_TOXCA|nr:Octopamine receptor 1 [Toxocara canis]